MSDIDAGNVEVIQIIIVSAFVNIRYLHSIVIDVACFFIFVRFYA